MHRYDRSTTLDANVLEHGGGPKPTVRVAVLVAGGRQLLRDGLGCLLGADEQVVVAGSCDDPLAVRAALQRHRVDVVVTHAFLGDEGGGARLAVELREERPGVGVVLLLGDGDPGEARAVLDQGTHRRALLLLDHPRCASDLVRAVHEVADGGAVVHPGVVDLLLRPVGGLPPGLTPREEQVLCGIASGASNRTIAEQLGLTERAVEKHINQLYAKLDLTHADGVHRRVAAARIALASRRRPA